MSELDSICIGIIPPTLGILEERLRSRNTESEDQIVKRLKQARKEIEFCETSKLVDARIINFDSWQHGYPKLKKLVSHHFPVFQTDLQKRMII
mmetsp:Transcript_13023/g.15181  ORF Transcript_13023/g.15181 Transcript_13023/m.15181 type:complete len:93 (-) Transcript_13023:601-879(-)